MMIDESDLWSVSSRSVSSRNVSWWSLYSCFGFCAESFVKDVRLFDYGVGHAIRVWPEARHASHAHTNLYIPNTFPKGWEFHARRWRATITAPLMPEIVEYLMNTSVRLVYQDVIAADDNLMSMVHSPYSCIGPVKMHEGRQFSCELRSDDRPWLVDWIRREKQNFYCWVYLEGPVSRPIA